MHGTISIQRPTGFLDSSDFQGYEQPSTGASIVVTGMTASVGEILDGFTDAALGRQGMRVLARETPEGTDGPRLLLQVAQTAGSIDYEKWIGVFGDDGQVALVTATYPSRVADQLSGAMREVVAGASWEPDRDGLPLDGADPGGSMPGLLFAGQFGNMAMYTRDGSFPVPSPESPVFVAGYSHAGPTAPTTRAFAEYRIGQIAGVRDIQVESSEKLTVDDLEACETTASGRSAADGSVLALYQLVVFDPPRYFLAQGIVGASEQEEYLPKFRHVARQFRRPPPKPARAATTTSDRIRCFDPFEPD